MCVIQLCVKIHLLVILRLRTNVLPVCPTVPFFLPTCTSVCLSISLDGWLLFFEVSVSIWPVSLVGLHMMPLFWSSPVEREREGDIECQTMSEPCLMPQINPITCNCMAMMSPLLWALQALWQLPDHILKQSIKPCVHQSVFS